MTVPVFTLTEFIAFIKDNGWVITSTTYWEKYNRIIFSKNGQQITFQCKDKYFYPEVVKTCQLFDITPPTDHIHQYYRHLRMDDSACYCEKGKEGGVTFKDCHGKI